MKQTVTFTCVACGATYRDAVAGENHCRRCETNARRKHEMFAQHLRDIKIYRNVPVEGYDRAVAF